MVSFSVGLIAICELLRLYRSPRHASHVRPHFISSELKFMPFRLDWWHVLYLV